jgi:hypothetical protein
MKKKIAKLWIKALESGKYKQIKGQLANKDGYCCLGVLCELAIENGVEVSRQFDKDTVLFDNEIEHLPKSVMKWAGMNNNVGYFYPLLNEENVLRSLAYLNDTGHSFKYIAGTIKQYWKEL